MRQIRQGDILLVEVIKQVPSNLLPKTEVVLATGELTGHAHILAGTRVYEWQEDGQRYVQVSGSIGTITHQEHDPIPAPVIEEDIVYQVIPQLEWDLKEQWRKVQD